ncbi:MAG: type II toxin-antitoxin system VapC family toxin [Planctomycetia bacterium]|nr:type II toxin-antitoxin system VapC family toxin [Planctomycetia bacterium]
MKILDVNVLLYAVNPDAVEHRRVRLWLESAMDGAEPVGLAWMVALGFLRTATNPRAFRQPLSTEDAIDHMGEWLSHPNVRMVHETAEHWKILKELLVQTGTARNLTSDAHLAALSIAHAATLVSCDLDFRRFRQLRWENPLASK